MQEINVIEESKSKKNKGFTLIELLIVIVILGILAAVTVFAVRGITNKGQDSACKTEQKTILTAVEAFYANGGTGIYPTTLAALVPSYMSTAPDSTSWTYATNTTAPANTKYTLAGVGKCASLGTVGSLT